MSDYFSCSSSQGGRGWCGEECNLSWPDPNSSFADLQSFCNNVRSQLPLTPSMCSYEDQNNSFHSFCGSSCHSTEPAYVNSHYCSAEYLGDPEEQGADWFDLAAAGYDLSDPEMKFDFPVPMEPVLPMSHLTLAEFSDGEHIHQFYVDQDDYVQVFTQGECRDFLVSASIGVWFGPNHPLNVSEKLHRGRRSQEAARFVAVIEAIRVAGSCGVTKLQINTDYINIVRFMIYFILKWEQNGWMTIRGTPVVNQTLIRELDYFSRLIQDVKWNYVPTDDMAEGNIEADRLAQQALDRVLR